LKNTGSFKTLFEEPQARFIFLYAMHRAYGSYFTFGFFLNGLKPVATICTEATLLSVQPVSIYQQAKPSAPSVRFIL
jgi:hypothetical protein